MEKLVIDAEKVEINVVEKKPETILYLIFLFIKSIFDIGIGIILLILVFLILKALF
jgi:hypothetical protein